jgi:hypothetical protein
MSTSQRVAFSLGDNRPPYIIGFASAVAERHVENLKIMRIIGGRKYADACRELTSEEILLRQKVYNFFNGPGTSPCRNWQDCFYWPLDIKIEGVTTWFGKGISFIG